VCIYDVTVPDDLVIQRPYEESFYKYVTG